MPQKTNQVTNHGVSVDLTNVPDSWLRQKLLRSLGESSRQCFEDRAFAVHEAMQE